MKSTLALVVATLVTAIAVAGAGANGSPYSPGLVHGWPGVEAEKEAHFVSFDMPKSTIVAAVRARDGRVLRSTVVKGSYGVPLVTYDGTSGGLSGDGRWLALSSYGPQPGAKGKTRFLVLGTKSFEPRLRIALRGSWSYDAIAPDGSTLYLTEHVRAGRNPLYRVRPLDVGTGRLGRALVDRLEGEWDMGGEPIGRASSADGRWAYTLYARRGYEPFVHALDTAQRRAYCIDIPLDVGYDGQWALKVKLRERSRVLAVTRGNATLATVRTDSWKVEKTVR
jgi:hypothetical protein